MSAKMACGNEHCELKTTCGWYQNVGESELTKRIAELEAQRDEARKLVCWAYDEIHAHGDDELLAAMDKAMKQWETEE